MHSPPPAQSPLGEFGKPVDRKQLWWSLLIPSALTLAAGVVIGLAVDPRGHMYGLPEPYLALLYVGPLAALLCLVWFIKVLRVRYRGGSLFFLSFAYLFGQVILQLAFGFCCCLGIVAIYD